MIQETPRGVPTAAANGCDRPKAARRRLLKKSAAVSAVRAMSVMPIRPVVGPMSVRHRGPAFWTRLCQLSHHAFRSLRHIRGEIGTKPHRIRRASLTSLGAALRGGAAHPHRANSNQ